MSQLGAILWAKGRISRHSLAAVRYESKLKMGVVGSAAVLLWFGLLLGVGFFFARLYVLRKRLDANLTFIGDPEEKLPDTLTLQSLAAILDVLFVPDSRDAN